MPVGSTEKEINKAAITAKATRDNGIVVKNNKNITHYEPTNGSTCAPKIAHLRFLHSRKTDAHILLHCPPSYKLARSFTGEDISTG